MHGYINRFITERIIKALSYYPVVAILGPRQSGKSTLAKKIISSMNSTYLDLQNRSDFNKLAEPEIFFETHRDELVCIDEIQLIPDFFSLLRSEVDIYNKGGRFLILGSASRELIHQSSETLAGRIAYFDLAPFIFKEVKEIAGWRTLVLRGGFPRSLLAPDDNMSYDWRCNFIRTFLERDIPQLGYLIPVPLIERLWILLSHFHGQNINYSKIASSADITQQSLKKYISILEQTYMLRLLQPFEENIKKRIVKSPKLYIRDSGILLALQEIDTFDDILSSPIQGALWEGWCIENIIDVKPQWRPYFLRTSNGAEIDLILRKGDKIQLFEFKFSKAPKPSRGFFECAEMLAEKYTIIDSLLVAPVDSSYQYNSKIRVVNIDEIMK